MRHQWFNCNFMNLYEIILCYSENNCVQIFMNACRRLTLKRTWTPLESPFANCIVVYWRSAWTVFSFSLSTCRGRSWQWDRWRFLALRDLVLMQLSLGDLLQKNLFSRPSIQSHKCYLCYRWMLTTNPWLICSSIPIVHGCSCVFVGNSGIQRPLKEYCQLERLVGASGQTLLKELQTHK